jgi:hypothetical protein
MNRYQPTALRPIALNVARLRRFGLSGPWVRGSTHPRCSLWIPHVSRISASCVCPSRSLLSPESWRIKAQLYIRLQDIYVVQSMTQPAPRPASRTVVWETSVRYRPSHESTASAMNLTRGESVYRLSTETRGQRATASPPFRDGDNGRGRFDTGPFFGCRRPGNKLRRSDVSIRSSARRRRANGAGSITVPESAASVPAA